MAATSPFETPLSLSIPQTQAHALFKNCVFAIEVNSAAAAGTGFCVPQRESAIQVRSRRRQFSGLGDDHLQDHA